MLYGISTDQMIEVDRIMMKEYHIPVELMMEHAGLNLARLAVDTFGQEIIVVVVAGSGNNGAGGITAARKLHGWGIKTIIFLPKGKEKLRTTAEEQLQRILQIIPHTPVAENFTQLSYHLDQSNNQSNQSIVILDAFIGYGFKQSQSLDPISKETFAYLRNHDKVISLDTPSGFDTTTGRNVGNVMPLMTLTIAFPKTGFLRDIFLEHPEYLGQLFVVDIGIPMQIFERKLGLIWRVPNDLQTLKQVYRQFSKHPYIPITLMKIDDQVMWKPRE